MKKRTVPYFPKGAWPVLQSAQKPNASNPKLGRSINAPKNWRRLPLEPWKKQMFALKEKFPDGWRPVKKLSKEQMEQLKLTRKAFPKLTPNELGTEFGISPEAVRRILRSRWGTDK